MFKATNSTQQSWEISLCSCMAKIANTDLQLHGMDPITADNAGLTQSKLKISFHNNLANIINYALWISNKTDKSRAVFRDVGYPLPQEIRSSQSVNYKDILKKFKIEPLPQNNLKNDIREHPAAIALSEILFAWERNALTVQHTSELTDIMYPDLPPIHKEYISMGLLTWFCQLKSQKDVLSGTYSELLSYLYECAHQSILRISDALEDIKKVQKNTSKYHVATVHKVKGFGDMAAEAMLKAYDQQQHIVGLPFEIEKKAHLVVAYVYLCGKIEELALARRLDIKRPQLRKYLSDDFVKDHLSINKSENGEIMLSYDSSK